MKIRKSFRQIIQYDDFLGHKYVPNLSACLKYGKSSYILSTDEFGFRNTKNKLPGIHKIIAIGDSFAAGDGVNNSERFLDIIEKNLNCEIVNLSISGFGVDQQILAYEKYGKKINHDIVLFFPHLDDLTRNLLDSREGYNRETGSKILIPKPYFTFKEGKLLLHNVPVPRIKEQFAGTKKANIQLGKKNSDQIGDMRFIQRGTISQQTVLFPQYANEKSKEWELMGPLINKLKELKGFRDLLIFPIPYIESIIERETSWHIQNFKKFEDSSTFIYDLSHLLQVEHNPPISSLFLDICGHFSPNGHKIVASEIANILESSFGIEVRAQEEKIEEKRCYIIGISCFYHDSAASLILDGSIIAAAQEERFTRIKHDKSFPINAINFCLEEKQICINDVKAFVYYDYETWTIERVLTNLKYISNKNQYWEQVKKGLFQKLKLPKIIREHTGYQGIIYKTQHHISHAASAYYPSKFDDAAILIIDGVGEWASSTIAKGSGNRIVILKQQHYPHSLGLLYSAFTYYAGFKINSGEYKLMGLAPYGNPRFVDLIKNQLVTINTDGSIMLNMDFFSFHKEQVMTNNKFNQLFGGKPRKRESKITTREMDIAASIQKVTEEIVIKMAKYAFELTKSKNLVMAGGVALNCVVNGRLFEETSFEDFYFQPASSDAGGALGCALSWYFENHPEANKKISEIETTYLGPNFSDDEIYAFLHTMDLPFHRFEKMSRALSIAQNIYENKIVGYFDGKMEFGPRALGSRSILANPLDPAMQSRLNLKIKFRESFRPFAPVYLEERTSLLFDFDKPSPYMSIVKKINSKLLNSTEYKQSDDIISIINQNRSEIPSVTHVDNSARLQSINIKQNQGMYEILQAFETLSGKGILINTSFNVRGEPIVCTPFDAYRCFMRTEIDILVLGNYFLLKSEQPNILSDDKWLNNFELD